MSRKKYEHPLYEQLMKRLQHEYEIYSNETDVRKVFYADGRVSDICKEIEQVEIPPRAYYKFLRMLKLLQSHHPALEAQFPRGRAAVNGLVSYLEKSAAN